MTTADTRETISDTDRQDMQALKEQWSPEWLIWRSRNRDGEPNEWCATRRGEGRELSMTLMERTARELEKALMRQADRSAFHG